MKSDTRVLLAVLSTCWVFAAQAGDLDRLGRNPSASAFARDAVEAGATSCRFNLEDMFVRALYGRSAEGIALYPEGDQARRPLSGMYVVHEAGKPVSHLQVVAGLDASGHCSIAYTESRVTEEPCSAYPVEPSKNETRRSIDFGFSKYTPLKGSLRVLLTPLANEGCLISESDVGWRLNPDADAAEWIKEDHGYDPAAEVEENRTDFSQGG